MMPTISAGQSRCLMANVRARNRVSAPPPRGNRPDPTDNHHPGKKSWDQILKSLNLSTAIYG
jgi:hypothetical protein